MIQRPQRIRDQRKLFPSFSPDGLLRVSVELEHPEDLVRDLESASAATRRALHLIA